MSAAFAVFMMFALVVAAWEMAHAPAPVAVEVWS